MKKGFLKPALNSCAKFFSAAGRIIAVMAAITAILALIMSAALALAACKPAGGGASTESAESIAAQTTAEVTVAENTVKEADAAEGAAEAATAVQIRVTDGLGSEIVLEEPAEKIIVFVPSALEIISGLNAMERVIGVDSWSLDSGEPLAQGLEAYGDFQALNMEKITAADPDMIIGLVGWAEADIQKLTDLGVIIYIVDANTIDEVYTEIENMGKITGLQSGAEMLVEKLRTDIGSIGKKVSELSENDKPKVFYEVWNDPLMSAGKNTFINELIEAAGGRNIVAEDGLEGWPEYSLEKLIQNNPDIIIAPVSLAPDADTIISDPSLAGVNAVINKKVYIIPDNPISRPSQNIIKGLEMLARSIHPEIFGEFKIIE